MPLRSLLRAFFQSRHGEELVQRLSETRFMRTAAQLVVYLYHRGRLFGEEAIEKAKDSDVKERFASFKRTFSQELKEGFKQLKDEAKKQQEK